MHYNTAFLRTRHSKWAILQCGGSQAEGVGRKMQCGRWWQAALYQIWVLLSTLEIVIFHFNDIASIMNMNANAFTELHHKGILPKNGIAPGRVYIS